jgi:hypothetical protein
MAYIAPIHHASSVRHALQVKLLSADEESLVLAYVGGSRAPRYMAVTNVVGL